MDLNSTASLAVQLRSALARQPENSHHLRWPHLAGHANAREPQRASFMPVRPHASLLPDQCSWPDLYDVAQS